MSADLALCRECIGRHENASKYSAFHRAIRFLAIDVRSHFARARALVLQSAPSIWWPLPPASG